MARKLRLDRELVAQGFFNEVDAAARAVMAGDVSTLDRRLDKPGEQVEPGIVLHVRGQQPYVSRGGLKLERALEEFEVDPTGLRCLDVGCSTGGFTDCLLRGGAGAVTAVDVGYAQFAWSLRQDARIELLERTNICDLAGEHRDGAYDLAVCDVSFTDVATVAPAIARLLCCGGRLVILVKPQFELPRSRVGAGGIVEDPEAWADALRSAETALISAGIGPVAACPSPIVGAKGNHEFLMYGIRGATPTPIDADEVASSVN